MDNAAMLLSEYCKVHSVPIRDDVGMFYIILERLTIHKIPRHSWIKPASLMRRIESKASVYRVTAPPCRKCRRI